jgi:hypothetical protein
LSLRSNGLDWVCSLQKIPTPVARTCPLVALVQPILHRVSCSNKTVWNAQNRRDFMAWTCALIASVRPILHWSSSSNEAVTP